MIFTYNILLCPTPQPAISTSKKAQGIKLGKPKGTIQRSKSDQKIEQIVDLLELGLSVRKIARHLGNSNHKGLNEYINRHRLRDERPKVEKIATIKRFYENEINGQPSIRGEEIVS